MSAVVVDSGVINRSGSFVLSGRASYTDVGVYYTSGLELRRVLVGWLVEVCPLSWLCTGICHRRFSRSRRSPTAVWWRGE